MNRAYSEKLLEDFIKLYPKEFLGEDLCLVEQQPLLEGFRPDLIFRDQSGTHVIVEIQIDALDRHHFYKTLEYRDLLMDRDSLELVRTVLVANSIPERFLKPLKAHRVEHIVISKDDFIAKAKALCPNLEITVAPETAGDGVARITASQILSLLGERAIDGQNMDRPDAWVFWTREWPAHEDNFYLRSVDLSKQPSENQPAETDDGRSEPPRETIVSETVSGLTVDQFLSLWRWVQLLSRLYESGPHQAVCEVVLGWRQPPDIYSYR